MDKIISNIEGLRNPTILQQLEAMRKYIAENAVKGDRGSVGINTVNVDYVESQQYYPVSSVRNYVKEQFVGQPIYFNNGYLGIVGTVYDSTPEYTPAFTVTNVVSMKGQPGTPGVGIKQITQNGTYQDNGFTVTDERVEYTDGTQGSFTVRAKNGESASGKKLYWHIVSIQSTGPVVYVSIFNDRADPYTTLEDFCTYLGQNSNVIFPASGNLGGMTIGVSWGGALDKPKVHSTENQNGTINYTAYFGGDKVIELV